MHTNNVVWAVSYNRIFVRQGSRLGSFCPFLPTSNLNIQALTFHVQKLISCKNPVSEIYGICTK
jgi:hypothetical protein